MRGAGIGVASLAAGPVFVLTTALAWLYLQLPRPIVIAPEAVGLVFGAAVLAILFGAIVALPINAAGAFVMLTLGGKFAPAQTRIAWALVGGVLGGTGAWTIQPEPQSGFALVATSAFCGWLCSFEDPAIRGGAG